MIALETREGLRELHKPDPPSAAILALGQRTENHIFENEAGRFCESTPMNFIGTLIVELVRGQFIEIGKQNGVAPTDSLKRTYTVTRRKTNLQIYHKD